jgi:hypothetical protein
MVAVDLGYASGRRLEADWQSSAPAGMVETGDERGLLEFSLMARRRSDG